MRVRKPFAIVMLSFPRAVERAKEKGADKMVFTIRRNGKTEDVDVPVSEGILFGFLPKRQTASVGPVFE